MFWNCTRFWIWNDLDWWWLLQSELPGVLGIITLVQLQICWILMWCCLQLQRNIAVFWLTVSDDSTHPGFEEYRNLKELAARGAHIAVIGAGYVGVACYKWETSNSSHRSTSENVHKTRVVGINPVVKMSFCTLRCKNAFWLGDKAQLGWQQCVTISFPFISANCTWNCWMGHNPFK